MNRRMPLAPAEGWSTLGLVILICLTMAWAMDDAAWVLGREKYLDYLPLAAIGGVLVGFIGSEGRLGALADVPHRGDLRGAAPAARRGAPCLSRRCVDPRPVPGDLQRRGQGMDHLAIEGQGSTIQYLHHVLIFGLLVWGTSMFASYATFGHRRPLNGVIAVGIVLVGTCRSRTTTSSSSWSSSRSRRSSCSFADTSSTNSRSGSGGASATPRRFLGLPPWRDGLHRHRGRRFVRASGEQPHGLVPADAWKTAPSLGAWTLRLHGLARLRAPLLTASSLDHWCR